MVVEHPMHPSFFVAQAVELLRPERAGRRTSPPSSSSSTSSSGLPDPAGARGDPVLAAALRRARGWSSRRPCSWPGMLRAPQARDHRRTRGTGCSPAAASGLYYPPDVSGWDDKRWLDTNTIARRAGTPSTTALDGTTIADRRRGRLPGRDAAEALAAARAFWGDPTLTRARRGRAAATFAARRDRRRRRSAPALRAQRQNALRQLIAAPPTTRPADDRPCACHCNDFCAPAPPAPAAACAAIEPGMPLPAGTGLSPPLVPRPRERARAGRLRRRALVAAAFEEGIARAAAGPAEPRARLDLPVGRRSTRCRCSRRSATRATRTLRPTLDARRAATRRRLRRGRPRCSWHPSAAPLRDLHRAGKVTRDPGDRLRRRPTSRTSPRATTGRSASSTRSAASAGSAATSTARRRRQPAAGPLARLDASRPRWPPASVPVAAVSDPEYFALDARDVWDGATVATALIDALARAGPARHRRPASSRRRPPRRAPDRRRCASQLAGAPGHRRRRGRPRSPTRATDGFARRLARARGDARHGPADAVVALDANGGYDTHDNQDGDAARQPRRCSRSRWPPSRPTSRRAASPTACCHVWSEFGRRPEENGTGTDHGAAGLSLLIGHAGQGHDGRRVPRPRDARRGRQPPPHDRLPRGLLLAARAVAGRRRDGHHARRLEFARPALVKQ